MSESANSTPDPAVPAIELEQPPTGTAVAVAGGAAPPRAAAKPNTQRREMSDMEKGMIIAYHNCQMPIGKIAKSVGRNWQTVRSFLNRYETRGTYANASRSGRPKGLTPEQEDAVVKFVRENPKIPKDKVLSSVFPDLELSSATLYRVLRGKGIRKFRAQARKKC
ncbi:hypothetical protein L211DRAFT_850899 [Terfezia boudieri ATCC MYA-4762]|uniref:Tc3 transposase DNA binding domain-containing protein n=1 Tax=Terfezia boudieri ATCC MYA-4762 TaxID=1051890 RepID=A0A3N4LGW0_9PEZI|nr:hypothetical protein L211DRAFT_850899 [Terfezia boudieri ATCC MYA-4762]